jgi:hypothetical protein
VACVGRRIAALASDPDRNRWNQKSVTAADLALFTPLAQSFATASGLPLFTVLMIQGIGFATPVLPYQASPIVVAMGMGKIPFAGGAAFDPSSGRDHLP